VPANDPRLAIGYIRVSTDTQELGPEAQRAALTAWASTAGVHLVEVFVDVGVSGAAPLEERDGLLAALAALKTRRAGVLVAAKRDRLARDVMVSTIIERAVVRSGARVLTADGMSDAVGPEGALLRSILDSFSAYEREVIRARTRAALAVKRGRGEKTGGDVPYGYRVEQGKLIRRDDEQATIALMTTLADRGRSQEKIAADLRNRGVVARCGRPFGKTQIARILRRVRTAPYAGVPHRR
jgi:DNA invertase Pin-like site-specific DNA recombinase